PEEAAERLSRRTLALDPLSLPQLDAGDGALVDLVRAVDDAHDARAGPGVGEAEILADAGAAMRLDRAVDHVQHHLRRHHLDHRDLGLRRLVPALALILAAPTLRGRGRL